MMKRWQMLLAGIFALATVQADVLRPTDFAWGMPLEPTAMRSVLSVTLPVVVYEGVMHGVDTDMRVFNADGEVVPHVLDVPERVTIRHSTRPLIFFSLPGHVRDEDFDGQLDVFRDQQGRIAEIRIDEEPVDPVLTGIYLIVLDGGEPVERICLDWQPGEGSSWQRLYLEYSDDLHARRWATMGSAVIGEVRLRGETIRRHCLPLPPKSRGFLRLYARERPVRLPIEHVEGWFSHQDRVETWNWVRLTEPLPPAAGETAGSSRQIWLVGARGGFPVERVRVRLPVRNSMAELTIFNRRDDSEPWRMVGVGRVYRLGTEDGSEVEETDIFLQRLATGRQWRFETDDGGVGRIAPQFELGYRPPVLRFLARGKPPFTLAWGSFSAGPPPPAFRRLFDAVPTDEQAAMAPLRLGRPEPLGGESALREPVRLEWGKWLLWLALGAGLVVLGFLVRSLYTELNGTRADGD